MRVLKRIHSFAVTLSFLFVLTSCIPQNGRNWVNISFPIGIRSKKKRIQPPLQFVSAIFDYKKEKGHWPLSETAFETADGNKEVIDNFYGSEFISWHIGYHSLDSLVVHFTHEPVYTQTFSILAFPGRDVNLKTTFIASKSIHKTELE